MPPEALDFTRRAQLTELMDEPCSRDLLREYLKSLARTNRWTFGYRPTLHWLDSVAATLRQGKAPIRILDVGCGYGDGLRRVEQWAAAREIPVELTGIDLNPDATAIAAEATGVQSRIQWLNANIFDFSPAQPPDLVLSALFTHHLQDGDIVCFLRWMEEHAAVGWFINDLSRAAVPYHFFRAFSKIVGLHPHVQYDGPISIRRAFSEQDWQRLSAAAGLNSRVVEIGGFTPARLCVGRRKLP